MSRYGAGGYREIRGVLAPEYRDLPDESIEAIVQASLGAVEAQDVEGFFSVLKDVGQGLAKVAPTVLPIAGTVAGTVIGGPVGAKLGGALGQVAGGAIQGAATGQRASTILKRAGGTLVSQAAGLVPGLGAAGGGGSPAAQQLLGILNRPEVLKSLMAMAMGQAGRSHVPVGGSPVPVGAFANLIGMLANQAATEHASAVAQEGESVPAYLLDEGGEFRVDPAVPEQRAQLVLQMLHESWPAPAAAEDEWGQTYFEDEHESSDEFYDMLELSEAYVEDAY